MLMWARGACGLLWEVFLLWVMHLTIFIKFLLCGRHCVEQWEYCHDVDEHRSWSCGAHSLVRVKNKKINK